MRGPRVLLTTTDERALQAITDDQRDKRARRAQTILLLADGNTVRAIAATTRMSPRRILHWKQRWREHGLDGLRDAPRPGRPPKLTPEVANALWAFAANNPERATTRSLAAHANLSHASIMRLWHEAGLYPSTMTRKEFLQKAAELATLASAPPPTPETELPVSIDGLEQHAAELHYRGRHAQAIAMFELVASRAAAAGDWRTQARAGLNTAYVRLGLGDLNGAMHVLDTIEDNEHFTTDTLIAAEVYACMGRIRQKQERFQDATGYFGSAERELASITGMTGQMPPSAATIGHSLVITHDCDVPAAAIRATIMHFTAKNNLLQGIARQAPGLITQGITALARVIAIDRSIGAEANTGFDLLWQGRGHLYRNDASQDDYKNARRCLSESNERFRQGAGRAYYYLETASINAQDDKSFQACYKDVETALDLFAKIPVWSGVAAAYASASELHAQANHITEALESSVVAAALEPHENYRRNLDHAALIFRARFGSEALRTQIRDCAQALAHQDEHKFAPVKHLINHGDGIMAPTLSAGITRALTPFLQWA